MSYPTNDVTTVHLNAGTDSISAARVELYTALTRLSELIDSRDSTSGLAPLDASSQVPAVNLPTTFTSGGSNDIIFQPATEAVVIQNVVTLTGRTVAQLEGLASAVGSVAYCSNGNAGAACLAVSTGTQVGGAYQWLRIALGVHVTTS
tara:strand:- start:405 stop:848 length:444 start_codon:yes stop_codon:yes gene_type:complete